MTTPLPSWQEVQLHGLTPCHCVRLVDRVHYARPACGNCNGAGVVGELPVAPARPGLFRSTTSPFGVAVGGA